MRNLIVIFISILLTSCGFSLEEKCAQEEAQEDSLQLVAMLSSPTFDAPFPGRNRNLARILGDTIFTYGTCHPERYKIISNRKSNSIVNIDNGGELTGKVSKYRGIYYLSERINDTTYRIVALQITDSLVYGFKNNRQSLAFNEAIGSGKFSKLVKYSDDKKKATRLHTYKREIKKLFATVIPQTTPLVLIKKYSSFKEDERDDLDTLTETKDFEVLTKAYPNPATDILNIELQKQQQNSTPYYLYDQNGKVVAQGQLPGIINKIDLSHLSNGIYNLVLTTGEQQMEMIKVIKTK